MDERQRNAAVAGLLYLLQCRRKAIRLADALDLQPAHLARRTGTRLGAQLLFRLMPFESKTWLP